MRPELSTMRSAVLSGEMESEQKMMAPADPGRPLRILYVDGPGNVLGTFRSWLAGKQDQTEVSLTFSGDFFSFAQARGARALVFSTSAAIGQAEGKGITVIHRPVPSRSASGIRYQLGEVVHGLYLAAKAITWKADIVIVADRLHWFALWPAKLMGKRIVAMLHCAFWPAGHRNWSRNARMLDTANAWFWQRGIAATLCVSPEAERQLIEICGRPPGPVLQVRSQYNRSYFSAIPAPPEDRSVFRVLFAGRIEIDKGIFDLLEIASRLENKRPGDFCFELCGEGSASGELKKRCAERNMQGFFRILGRQDMHGMAAAYGRSHAVIVPTTVGFAEGMNRVCIEGVLAHRPVITSRLSHATDVLGPAIIEVAEGDLDGYVAALERLKDFPDVYLAACDASRLVEEPFYDRQQGYQAALDRATDICLPSRTGS